MPLPAGKGDFLQSGNDCDRRPLFTQGNAEDTAAFPFWSDCRRDGGWKHRSCLFCQQSAMDYETFAEKAALQSILVVVDFINRADELEG